MRLLSCLFALMCMLPLRADESSYHEKIVLIKVGAKDLLNTQSFKFWKKTLQRVNQEQAKAVIFELNTPGGLAIETKDLMVNELRELQVPSYAFVNSEAISAGALIAVATDEIWMTPHSTIGAAGIVNSMGTEMDQTSRAKIESFFDANVRAVTKDKGHATDIVKMMMFMAEEERSYGPITVDKGKLLTLTAEEAAQTHEGKPVLAKGIAENLSTLLQSLELQESLVVEATPQGFEKVAWYIASISSILILVGIGGLYLEMQSPGFGLGGVVALIAFGIFFFGNSIAGNLAGYELAFLFFVGLVFIVIEVFVFPSLFMGLIGGLMVVASLLLAMVDKFDLENVGAIDLNTSSTVGWFDILESPLRQLCFGLLGGMVVILILFKLLKKVPLPGLVLKSSIGEHATTEMSESKPVTLSLQESGIALTDLRPTGKVRIQNVTYDVTTKGEFISKGSEIVVISTSGMQIEVQEKGV